MGPIIAVVSVFSFVSALSASAPVPAVSGEPALEEGMRDVTPESLPLLPALQVFVAQLSRPAEPTGWSGLRQAGTQPDRPTTADPAGSATGQIR